MVRKSPLFIALIPLPLKPSPLVSSPEQMPFYKFRAKVFSPLDLNQPAEEVAV